MSARRGAKPGRRGQLPWRRDRDVMLRLEKVERLHLTGYSTARISGELKVSIRTVTADLSHLRELWAEKVQGTQEELRQQAAAHLLEVAHRALDCADFDEKCTRAALLGEPLELGQGKSKQLTGELSDLARFRGQRAQALGVARQALLDRAKVLGVVVNKVAPTDGDGNALSLAELASLARESRARREAAARV